MSSACELLLNLVSVFSSLYRYLAVVIWSVFSILDSLLTSIGGYETIIPETVDKHGRFVSFHVTRNPYRAKPPPRVKRATDEQRDVITDISEYRIFYRFSVFGKEFHFDLILNTDFIGPGFRTEFRSKSGIQSTSTEVPNCYYIGQSREPFMSTAAISNCYGLVGISICVY